MTDERFIWNALMMDIKNSYGAAGVMGNLKAESNLNPLCMTGANASKYVSAKEYAEKVDSGKVTRSEFCHDGIAFGLAQWLFWSRKDGLYQYALARKAIDSSSSIGSLETQIGYLLEEIPKYTTVWETICNAKEVKEASDIVMLKYEKPANLSATMKDRRLKFSCAFWAMFTEEEETSDVPVNPIGTISKIRTTADRVFVRTGNGKNYNRYTRVEKAGTEFPYVATADNGWYAIKTDNIVGWISAEFSEPVYE